MSVCVCVLFQGLPSKLLLSHHGIPNSHCLVTLYDEAYARMPGAALPALRSWHPDKMAWAPERSDEPAVGRTETPPGSSNVSRCGVVVLLCYDVVLITTL